MTGSARCSLLCASLLVGLAPAGIRAQVPVIRLTSVQPVGGQQGTTLDVTVGGSDIDDVTRLVFSHPGITATVKMQAAAEIHPALVAAGLPKATARPLPGQFTVTIGKEVPPGVYQLRAVGRFGISNPRFFQVSLGTDVQEKEGNDSVEQAMEITVGTTINGRSDRATDEDHYKLALKKDERVLAECFAWRIDSQLEPVLKMIDSRGVEVATGLGDRRRDALIDYTAKQEGVYVLQVRDRTYRGGGDHFYRLQVHRRPYIDVVYPPVIHGGAATEVTLIGRNLPGSRPIEGFDVDGRQLESIRVRVRAPASHGKIDGALVESRDASADLFLYRFEHAGVSSNPLLLAVGYDPVRTESEPNDDATKATRVEIPCEIGGRFWPRRDRDWIEFEARKGEVVRIEVYSQRLGLATDPVFAVYQVSVDKEGKETVKEITYQDNGAGSVAGNDFNTATDDPAWTLTAAADGIYRVQIRDLFGASSADPRNVWRLSLRRPTPDFSLVATASFPAADQKKNPGGSYSPFLRPGGSDRIKVYTLRSDGFKGAIELLCEGLPDGVTQQPTTIPAGQNGATIQLRATAKAQGWAGSVRIVGKSKVGDVELRRTAFCGARVWSANRSRVGGTVVLGVSAHEPEPLLASATNVTTAPGGKVELPVSLVRSSWATGKVTIEGSGVPKNVELKKFTINEKDSAAKPTLNVKKGAPVGEHRFRLRADTEIQYRRNPQAEEAAKLRHDKLGEILKSFEEAKGEADKALAAATKAATETAAATKSASEALSAADKALADLETRVTSAKKATDEATAAAEAASGLTGPEKDRVVKAKEQAQSELTDAEAKRNEAAEKRKSASEVAGAAKADSAAAAAARTKADAATKETTALVKVAKDAQIRAKSTLDAANKANNPQKRKVRVESEPIIVRIASSAIDFDGPVAPEKARLTQGGSVEVPVKIKRLFGFDAEVELKVALPKDAKQLKTGDAKIAKGASEAKVKIEAAAGASPRQIEVTIEANGKFGGVDQKATAKFLVVITSPPAPPKPETAKKSENEKK